MQQFLKKSIPNLITCYSIIVLLFTLLQPAPAPRHLENIRRRITNDEADQAQQLFPEARFFSYVMYGNSWVNLALADANLDTETTQRASQEARWALEELQNPIILAQFGATDDLPHGIFYHGWANRLRGGILLIDPELRHSQLADTFHLQSEMLANAIVRSKQPFLEAYPDQTWPVDTLPALSSLLIHDQLFDTNYANHTVTPWIQRVASQYHTNDQLLPHQVISDTGFTTKSARGESSALASTLLPEIDSELAKQQQHIFEQFIYRFGPVLLTKQHYSNELFQKTTNSGPVAFGIGATASIVQIAAQGAQHAYEAQYWTAWAFDLLGLPTYTAAGPQYLFGKFLPYDIFLTWARTHRKWVEPSTPPHAATSHQQPI